MLRGMEKGVGQVRGQIRAHSESPGAQTGRRISGGGKKMSTTSSSRLYGRMLHRCVTTEAGLEGCAAFRGVAFQFGSERCDAMRCSVCAQVQGRKGRFALL